MLCRWRRGTDAELLPPPADEPPPPPLLPPLLHEFGDRVQAAAAATQQARVMPAAPVWLGSASLSTAVLPSSTVVAACRLADWW